jgi:hypothetical protein
LGSFLLALIGAPIGLVLMRHVGRGYYLIINCKSSNICGNIDF